MLRLVLQRTSTTGMLELDSATAEGWQLLHGQHLLCFGKGGGRISTNPLEGLCLFLPPLVPFKYLSPRPLALATLKEEPLVLLMGDRPPSLPTSVCR